MSPFRITFMGLAILWAGCAPPAEETVVQTWPDTGAPKEIHTELTEGAGTEVRIMHGNGRIHIRGLLKDGVREGIWNTYREDGMPWSQVSYARGLKDGLFRTWHPGGIPHIEGQHRANQPDSTWRFYGTDGQLVQTEFYEEGTN